MDMFRRSFRRGSVRRQREPLSESPNLDSPPVDEPPSALNRLRSSFRRSFRRPAADSLAGFVNATSQQTSSQTDSNPPTVMDRLRRSVKRSVHQRREPLSESPTVNSQHANDTPVTPSPLDKSRQGFRRSFRGRRGPLFEDTKPKPCSSDGIDGPIATLDKLRRSFRRSLRRQRGEPSGDTPKLNYWQTDEMDVQTGTCFFNVKYLGGTEVFEARGILMCEEAFKDLKKSRKRPIKSLLFISGNGLRVVEKNTRGLLVDQSINMLSFCGPVRNHEKGFAFICLNASTLRWMCYCFIAKEPGERLSNAVGCAFAIYFERKKKRDDKCKLTMNFDLSSSSITRAGSLRRRSLTDKSTINGKNSYTDSASLNTNTTIININNNINTDDENKENVPVETATKTRHHFDQSVFTVPTLRRQQSFREVSYVDDPSPFKRQLSLRLRDLPSNVERIKSQSAELPLPPRTPSNQYLHLKTPVSPIAEVSPGPANIPANSIVPSITKMMDRTTAMKRLSQRFGVSETADPFNSDSSQFNIIRKCASEDFFTKKIVDHLPPSLIDIQPAQQPPCQELENNVKSLPSTSQGMSHTSVRCCLESSPARSQCSVDTALTPPTTPSPARVDQTPRFYPWLGPLQLDESATSPLSSSSPSKAILRPTPTSHARSHSLSHAETMMKHANSPKAEDPFNIDWTLWVTSSQPKKKRNTNPFLSDSPVSEPSETTTNEQN